MRRLDGVFVFDRFRKKIFCFLFLVSVLVWVLGEILDMNENLCELT